MTVKPTAITNEEIQIYQQEENLARLYERREEVYTQLLEELERMKGSASFSRMPEVRLALAMCEFLMREAMYRKLV